MWATLPFPSCKTMLCSPFIIAVKGLEATRIHIGLERGLRGLGQTLKSFRDREVEFSVYGNSEDAGAYLRTLGKLEKPGQISSD